MSPTPLPYLANLLRMPDLTAGFRYMDPDLLANILIFVLVFTYEYCM